MEIKSYEEMKEDVEGFEKRLLKNCSKLELFFYLMHQSESCRIHLMFNPLSSFNQQHAKIIDKMNKEYTSYIEGLMKRLDVRYTNKTKGVKNDTSN